MKKQFAIRHISLAVVATMASATAVAQAAEPNVTLDREVVTLDRQGTKVSTNVVNLRKKDESAQTGLRELLKAEPAIDFGSGNGTSQYINIRGMGQNSIDVKIDNAYSDTQMLYHQGRHQLDPSLVKIVEVQKGAGSASAGIGATNGAIVAKTVEASDLLREGQEVGFKVGAGYSSNDENSYNASVYGKKGAFDALIAYNRVQQDNYKAGKGYVNYLGGDTVPSSDVDRVSYLAKVGATFGDHRFVLSHMNITDKGVRNVREEMDIKAGNPRLSLARQNPQYRELTIKNTNLEWTGKNLGFITEAKANVYMMENKRESATDQGGYGSVAGYNEMSVDTKGLNVNFDSQVNEGTLLKYGVNYRHQEIDPNQERTGFVHQEKEDTGVYVEAIGDIGNVTATAGLRYDHFDITAMDGRTASNDSISPSLGLIWQATPTLSFSANHYYATRSPRLVDVIRSGNARTTIDENIKAEQAKNTEVGFNYNNGNVSVNGSYYWQKIDNLTNSGTDNRHGTGWSAIRNAGYSKNHGWELGAVYRYQGLTARVGVAESNPEFYGTFTNTNGQLVGFSDPDFGKMLGRTWTAGLAYRFAYPNLEVGANYRRVDDVTGSIYKTPETMSYYPGYETVDLYANWKPLGNDRVNVNFAVNNITDEFYIPQTSRSGSDYATASGLPGVGREYRVGVNFTY